MSARSSGRGSRSRRGRRQKSESRPRRVLVVTNGEVTEKQYCDLLNATEDEKRLGERNFHIICKTQPVDPWKLAKYALSLIDKDKKASAKKNGGTSDTYSLAFVVVDVDDMLAKNPNNLREAQRLCDDNDMRLVISDPCFEVWLIDHVMVCPSHILDQKAAETLAGSKGLTTGRKNKYLVLEKLRDRLEVAVSNAEAHNLATASVHRKSLQGKSFAPWTDFPELVNSIGAL